MVGSPVQVILRVIFMMHWLQRSLDTWPDFLLTAPNLIFFLGLFQIGYYSAYCIPTLGTWEAATGRRAAHLKSTVLAYDSIRPAKCLLLAEKHLLLGRAHPTRITKERVSTDNYRVVSICLWVFVRTLRIGFYLYTNIGYISPISVVLWPTAVWRTSVLFQFFVLLLVPGLNNCACCVRVFTLLRVCSRFLHDPRWVSFPLFPFGLRTFCVRTTSLIPILCSSSEVGPGFWQC